MLSNDQPISRPGDDLYDRADFALSVSRSIANLPTAIDGFAFAITGEWGAGKSSVLHLIERYLLQIEMERRSQSKLWWQEKATPRNIPDLERMALLYEKAQPKIDELVSQHKYLICADIREQRKTLREFLPSDEAVEDALLYWHLKVKIAEAPDVIVVKFSPWLIAGRAELASALFSELARTLQEYLGNEVRDAFSGVLKRLSEFLPVAGAGLSLAGVSAGPITQAASKLFGGVAEKMTRGDTLEELRAKLRSTLRNLKNQRILVILDDVDRLTPDEAAEIVSLVKSLGDLPNVIYLLSYHRPVLCKLIKTALRVDGGEYLEKIIQREINLPPIENSALIKAVNANFLNLFKGINLDAKRLGTVWYRVLRHYIRQPRDTRRYFNALIMAQAGLGNITDPIDLIVLQAVQVFDPDIYRYVRDNINELVN